MIKPKICNNFAKFLMIMLGAWKEKLKMKCSKIYLKPKKQSHLKIILSLWESKLKEEKKEYMKNLFRQSEIQDKKNITETMMMMMTQNISYLLLLNNQKQES